MKKEKLTIQVKWQHDGKTENLIVNVQPFLSLQDRFALVKNAADIISPLPDDNTETDYRPYVRDFAIKSQVVLTYTDVVDQMRLENMDDFSNVLYQLLETTNLYGDLVKLIGSDTVDTLAGDIDELVNYRINKNNRMSKYDAVLDKLISVLGVITDGLGETTAEDIIEKLDQITQSQNQISDNNAKKE